MLSKKKLVSKYSIVFYQTNRFACDFKYYNIKDLKNKSAVLFS